MRTYQFLFFDLDGTLTDSAPGILNSVTYALRKYGLPIPDQETLRRFVGPPLLESFQKYCGLSEPEARRMVSAYREYYPEKGIFENTVYPGIPALLERVRRAGLRPVMATAKPEAFALRIAEHFGLADSFALIAGASMDESRITKEAVIRYAMERLGIRTPETVLMVGDREHDVLGARACGVDCAAVLYGYGDREELERVSPAFLAETPEQLAALLGI